MASSGPHPPQDPGRARVIRRNKMGTQPSGEEVTSRNVNTISGDSNCTLVTEVVNPCPVDQRFGEGGASQSLGRSSLPTNPVEALGDTLITRNDGVTVPVARLRGPDRYIALLFSAAWCAPCKQFVPELIEFYNKYKSGPNASTLEIVYISHDNSEDQFKGYFNEMPWPAVPFRRRDIKEHLNNFLRVYSIPAFLVLDSESGAVITNDGVHCVLSDPNGASFPWRPRGLEEILNEADLISKEGRHFRWKDLRRGYKALYFSGKWCPPCRSFTPTLATFVETLQKNTPNTLDVIFVSSDRSEESFQQYFDTMPWYAVNYSQEHVRKELSTVVGVRGIPTLVLLDSAGRVITKEARQHVNQDPKGSRFPWRPRVVEELGDSHATIVNSEPCLIIFTDGNEEEMEQATSMFLAIAEETKVYHEQKQKPALRYFTGGDAEICETLREYARLEDAVPLVVILDIARGTKYLFDDEWLTTENLLDFVTKFYEGSLLSRPLQKK